MRCRVREPNHRVEKKDKEKEEKYHREDHQNFIIEPVLCEYALEKFTQNYQYLTNPYYQDLLRRFIEHPYNLSGNTGDLSTLRSYFKTIKGRNNKWTKKRMYEEWVIRHRINKSAKLTEALVFSLSNKCHVNDIKKQAFEEEFHSFVEVLLYWRDMVDSNHKGNEKQFYEDFYEAIEQLTDELFAE